MVEAGSSMDVLCRTAADVPLGPLVAPSHAHIERVVRRVSRVVPGVTCRHEAACACAWLRHAGEDAHVVIGLAKQDGYEGHAWVESRGATLLLNSSRFEAVARW